MVSDFRGRDSFGHVADISCPRNAHLLRAEVTARFKAPVSVRR